MSGLLSTAAGKWLRMPKVTRGFLNFIVQPAAVHLVLPALTWLETVFSGRREYDPWQDHTEDALVNYLRYCWDREGSKIAADAQLRDKYLNLLGVAVARGSHAAIALRDRIAGAGGSQ
jgi:hypothetical protein